MCLHGDYASLLICTFLNCALNVFYFISVFNVHLSSHLRALVTSIVMYCIMFNLYLIAKNKLCIYLSINTHVSKF